jgi:DNA-binding Lrp family transcriptional regulator
MIRLDQRPVLLEVTGRAGQAVEEQASDTRGELMQRPAEPDPRSPAPAAGPSGLLSRSDEAAALREALGPDPGSVVDLSANRTTLELSGPSARQILEKSRPWTCTPGPSDGAGVSPHRDHEALRKAGPDLVGGFPSLLLDRVIRGRIFSMDALDRKILTELQLDGRLTVTELAARVKLSVSPCHRRLRDLEREGAIRGYRAVVDPAAVGLNFEALVFVTLRWEDADTVSAFEEAVAAVPHVLQAQRLFGDPDYLLRVATTDLAAFQQLYDQRLARLPGVQRLNSTLVMKHIVDDRPLPE